MMATRGRRPNTSRDSEIAKLAARGFSRSEIAKSLLISAFLVCRAVKRLKLDCRDARGERFLGTHDQFRADAMAERYKSGETLQQIGDSYGISRERVRQVLRKRTPVLACDGGQALKAAAARRERATQLDKNFMARLGCDWAEYKRIRQIGLDMRAAGRSRGQTPLYAYSRQKTNAAKRGIGWELTFWDWWSIWQQSGRWDQRGRGQGYVMCRRGDTGPYSIADVFIATAIENTSSGKHKKTGLPTGVRFKRGRYEAQRNVAGKRLHLGTYATPALAYAAYVAAAPGFQHRPAPASTTEANAA